VSSILANRSLVRKYGTVVVVVVLVTASSVAVMAAHDETDRGDVVVVVGPDMDHDVNTGSRVAAARRFGSDEKM
jgi:hypothetical protein